VGLICNLGVRPVHERYQLETQTAKS
jgi:hypothetical protein